MSSDFYTAEEDSERYDSVCDIRKKKNRKDSNVLTSFSGLECPETQLYQWKSQTPLYIKKFKKAKQCVQRRITKMKEFSGTSTKNKTERRKHVYPIQVAYTYGKDCLKKFASENEQKLFQTSVDELINKVSNKQTNIKNIFGTSIENSIKTSSPSIRTIFDRTYYDKNQQNIIDKERLLGYNALNEKDRELFYSVFNEGFSKKGNEYYEDTEEIELPVNENLTILKPSKTFKKNIRKRQMTKRKVKLVESAINLNKLNELLVSNKFKITNAEKLTNIKLKIKELCKLYVEKVYIDEKMFMLEDVFYGSSEKKNKINLNIYGALDKSGIIKPTQKSVKQAGITENSIPKFKAADNRYKLYKDIADTHDSLRTKLFDIINKIKKILFNADKETSKTLQEFYLNDIAIYIKSDVNQEIAKLSVEQLNELIRQKKERYSLKATVKQIDKELSEVEQELLINTEEQRKAQNKMNNKGETKLMPQIRILFENKLKELKAKEKLIEKRMLDKYNQKTDKLRELIKEISNKYENPLILLDKMTQLELLLSVKPK